MTTAQERSGQQAAERASQCASLGAYGEAYAARHLASQGMVVLDKNWRCELGEIDLVLRDGSVLVVCEVKTRSSRAFGAPLEAVTQQKAARLRRLAARWLAEHTIHPDEVRIDLVGVLVPPGRPAELEHARGVA
ncbi:MAG: YraN family protein [Actinomycetota bacterium]|nr:YraN family protein [Actinomycetota bacterium]